ncbi:hypothetical protein [Roseateles depolymerans]|uniref:hypothetical protein n=1 Tax=Roseateles depolymerans TaxID=76731 RepID=UPI000E26E08F|nr:hypothetical protein [Roseateles depolymerans]
MKVIGSTSQFAMHFGESTDQLRTVEVWVQGKSITPFDSSAYVPGFSAALARSENALKKDLNFLRYESLFLGLSVEEAFLKLAEASSPHLEQAWLSLRFADWGPTTDDFLCFLIPVGGRLYLACQELSTQAVHAAQITPDDLLRVLEGARHELSACSKAS